MSSTSRHTDVAAHSVATHRAPSQEPRHALASRRARCRPCPSCWSAPWRSAMNLTGPLQPADAEARRQAEEHADGARQDHPRCLRRSRARQRRQPVRRQARRQPSRQRPAYYASQAGDTVSSIAGKYGLSTASVLALNGLGWKSLIFPGQSPRADQAGAAPAPAPAPPRAASGEPLHDRRAATPSGKIAARFGVTTQSVLERQRPRLVEHHLPGPDHRPSPATAPAVVHAGSTVAPVDADRDAAHQPARPPGHRAPT